jgi:hypothetical protein
MSQEEQRPEPVDAETARERVAAYRAGIPKLQAREADFQALLTPEQRSAYLRLQSLLRRPGHRRGRERGAPPRSGMEAAVRELNTPMDAKSPHRISVGGGSVW